MTPQIKDTIYNIPDFDVKSISIIGNGAKGLLVICDDESMAALETTTLQKLISAIKHDFNEDIYYVRIPGNSATSVSNLGLKYKRILVFGLDPSQIGFQCHVNKYEITHFENCQVLFSDNIQIINSIQSKKETLWKLLQAMFLSK